MTTPSKLVSAKEAAASIEDGAHLTLSGFAITRNPMAISHELIRQNKKNLTISQGIGTMDIDMMVGAGMVKCLLYAGGSLDRPGPLHNVNRAIAKGTIECHEYSFGSISMRFLAGALGIPHIPVQSLLGSDILNNLLKKDNPDVMVDECPFTKEKVVRMRALEPDYAIVHVPRADEEGNAVVYGPKWDEEAIKAAKKIIVLADEIVSNEEILLNPDDVVFPSTRVNMVAHQPYGAYPTAVYTKYDYDIDHLHYYVSYSKSEEGMQQYLDKYVRNVNDFYEFLEKFGGLKTMQKVAADSMKKY